MAAQRSMNDFLISSEEEEEQVQVSQNASQNLCEDDEEQLYSTESTLYNKISIEDVIGSSTLFEELQPQSDDENYRNTIITSDISGSPMTPAQESQQKKSKKHSIKSRK